MKCSDGGQVGTSITHALHKERNRLPTPYVLEMLGPHPNELIATLYGLCVKRRIATTKVIGIASRVVKQKLVSELLSPVAGEFYELCRVSPLCITGTQFSAESVRAAHLEDDKEPTSPTHAKARRI